MNSTDQRILKLIDKLVEKKKKIDKSIKPKWVTSCSFSEDENAGINSRVNIQTVSTQTVLIKLYAKLVALRDAFEKANKELGTNETFTWQGYSMLAWRSDFKTRIEQIKLLQLRAEYAAQNKELDSIISPELKTKLILDRLEKAI